MKDKALDALEGLQELNENELYYKSENGMLFSFNLDQTVIVLKQALQSNVSEDIKKEYILIERSFEKWAKRDDYDYSDNLAYFSFLKLRSKLNDLVTQSQPTLLDSELEESKDRNEYQLLDEIEKIVHSKDYTYTNGTRLKHIELLIQDFKNSKSKTEVKR